MLHSPPPRHTPKRESNPCRAEYLGGVLISLVVKGPAFFDWIFV